MHQICQLYSVLSKSDRTNEKCSVWFLTVYVYLQIRRWALTGFVLCAVPNIVLEYKLSKKKFGRKDSSESVVKCGERQHGVS